MGVNKTIIIRSGGLGDFILTLNLIAAVKTITDEVILITKSIYYRLIENDGLADRFIDIDGALFTTVFTRPEKLLQAIFHNADVLSFLTDPDDVMRKTFLSCQVRSFAILHSRSTGPRHVIEQMFVDGGLKIPDGMWDKPILNDFLVPSQQKRNVCWLHPGSGSPRKNTPLMFFRNETEKVLAAGGVSVIISLGEADGDLRGPIETIFTGLPFQFLIRPSLMELRRRMAVEASHYIGNDSGVTHLAAAMGIPTSVFFVATDPVVWRPLGRNVRVIDLRSQIN